MRIEIRDKENFIKMFNNLFEKDKINKVNGVCIDSRKIKQNDIYIPIKGKKYDGHDFIIKALKNGAIKCLSEKNNKDKDIIKIKSSIEAINTMASIWNKKSKHKIIGITGSNGKTTTKELIYNILSTQNSCSKSIGNYNSKIGLPISYLNTFLNDEYCILEYGASKPGEIKSLCKIIKPHIAVITNIGNAHIKNYSSIKNIYNTKKAIFQCLNNKDIAFINLDDKYISSSCDFSCKKIFYSSKKTANYKAEFNNNKSIFKINNKKFKLNNDLKHLIDIILPAYSICAELGISHNAINKSINTYSLEKGRGKSILIDGIEIIDDSYNANPSSVLLAINRLNSIVNITGKKVFVLGDMLELGNKSINEHKKIGDYFNKTNINIIITYGNKTFHTHESVSNKKIKKYHFNKMEELRNHLKENIKNGDLIYLKGSRSMQLEKIYETGLA